MWNEKRAAPPTFLRWRQLFTLPLYSCMKQIFLTKVGILLHIRFLKLVYSEENITSVCFQAQARGGRSKNAYQIDISQLLSFCKIEV